MSSNPRPLAVRTALERHTRSGPAATDAEGRPLQVRDFYGELVFDEPKMRDHLSADQLRRFQAALAGGERLEADLAEQIARGVLDWALEHGATHFCHWFQPMTGATAEKHDGFLRFDGGRPIASLSGSQLIQSEPDASSFPSGGMRSTFEARGYTAWDPSSPMFIMERAGGATLCIPSIFVTYHGDAMDKKAPLLRSMQAIGQQAVRLCGLLGDTDVQRVTPSAGPEQEYFLVDRAYAAFRPDLTVLGRTVLGAPAPKGQSLDDHYFGAIPSRALSFMNDLEHELYRLGVPAITRHNEVAPSQFEIAVEYRQANIAADHNQLVMECIKKMAERHGLLALLHEKPFAGVNGSGKHLNWSLATNTGDNLLSPGKNPQENHRFLAVLAGVLLGVHKHAGLLRAAVATYGNDFRLGANEAPPAIMSVFLGEQLTRVCEKLINDEEPTQSVADDIIDLELGGMPELERDNTDRNRTSPFAFTGNKFEFRAVGSNQSISWPLAIVNLVVADGISMLCDRIEASGSGTDAILEQVRAALADSKNIRFEGNNYSDEWAAEAARRGLPNLKTTADALAVLESEQTRTLFDRFKVLGPAELESRFHVQVEQYVTAGTIEADLLFEMVDQSVLPAALAYRTTVAADIAALRGADASLVSEADLAGLRSLSAAIGELRAARAAAGEAFAAVGGLHEMAAARKTADALKPALDRLRAASDALEVQVADANWTLPKYREMLFQNG